MGGLGAWNLDVTSNNVSAGYEIRPCRTVFFHDQRGTPVGNVDVPLIWFILSAASLERSFPIYIIFPSYHENYMNNINIVIHT